MCVCLLESVKCLFRQPDRLTIKQGRTSSYRSAIFRVTDFPINVFPSAISVLPYNISGYTHTPTHRLRHRDTQRHAYSHTHTQTDMHRHTYALTPLADGRGNPSSGAVGYWCLLWCWLAAALLPWQLPTDSLAWWLVLSSREVAGLLFKIIIINNREEPGRHLKSLTCCLDTLMSDLFF